MAKVVDSLGHVQVSMKDYLSKVDPKENSTACTVTTTVPEAVEVQVVQVHEDSMEDSCADTHSQKDSDDSTVSD